MPDFADFRADSPLKVLRKDAKNYTNVKIHIGIFIFTDLSTNQFENKKVA